MKIFSWLQPFRPSNQDGSQEHISLITYSFCDDFAFIVWLNHKQYVSSWLYLICYFFTTGHFCMCVICKKTELFFTLILGSVFDDYAVFYGMHAVYCRRYNYCLLLFTSPAEPINVYFSAERCITHATKYKPINVHGTFLRLLLLLARPASRCRRRAYVLLMLFSFFNVALLVRQRVDGSQRELLR